MDAMLSNIICLDFEASAITDKSYPIEVGVCTVGTAEVLSWLIKPTNKWQTMGEWNEESAKIHNIPNTELMDKGLSVDVVAQELRAYCQGKTVISDAPSYDGFWLVRLYEAVGQPVPFQFTDFHDFALKLAARTGRRPDIAFMKAEQEAYTTCPYIHRAGADARCRAEMLRLIAGIS